MQQLKLHYDPSYKINNQKTIILCEYCLLGDKKAVKVCIYCLQFVCQQCAQTHPKHKDDPPLFQSKMKWIEMPDSSQEFYKNQISSTQQSETFRDSKFTNKSNCQRCQLKVANKICLGCSSRIFCYSCFNQLHSTQKFRTHKTTQIQKNESKFTEKSLIEVKKDSIFKKLHKQRFVTQNIKLQNKASCQNHQKASGILNKKSMIEQLNKNIVNLQLMSASICQNTQKMQRNYEQLFVNINKELEEKIEELKLRLLEIQLKFKSKKDQIAGQNKDILDQIGKIVINYKNIETLFQNRLIAQSEKMIEKKLQNVSKKYQLIQQKCEQRLSHDLEIKISQQFNIDMEILKEKISKIQYKRIVQKQQIKNTLLMVSSPKSEKKLNYQFKSDNKTFKKPLNLTSCKSQTKVNPLTISQNNSQSNSKSRKNSKNQNKLLISSPIQLKSYATTPSDQLSINRTLFSIKNLKQPKKTELAVKQIRSKGTLQKSARFSNKTPFFETKSGVNKALLNIESTKKMIDQMRNQIIEFPCYKFITSQSQLLTNTDRQDEFLNQQIQQKLNTSTHSLLFEQETSV